MFKKPFLGKRLGSWGDGQSMDIEQGIGVQVVEWCVSFRFEWQKTLTYSNSTVRISLSPSRYRGSRRSLVPVESKVLQICLC